ncbi:MAG: hypothetical protein J6O04_01475 [Selenomonadaceae bacterium]|nr:hypothetical protein [Selenomonadaceae bacterium]
MYRYLNPGYIDLFKNTPGTEYNQVTDNTKVKTKTGVGFCSRYPGEMQIPTIPAGIKEMWFKLDYYTTSAQLLFQLRIRSSNTYCGFGYNDGAGFYEQRVYVNGSYTSLSCNQTLGISTYWFHILSDASNGIFECIRDDVTLFSKTGNILNGEDISNITCGQNYSNANRLISNIIVSDTAIDMAEQVMAIPCNITTDMTDNGDGTYTATALNQYLRFGLDSSIATTLASGTKITGASLAARSCIRDGEGIETLEAYDGATLLGSDSIPTTDKTGVSVGVTLDNTVSQFLTHNYEWRAK